MFFMFFVFLLLAAHRRYQEERNAESSKYVKNVNKNDLHNGWL